MFADDDAPPTVEAARQRLAHSRTPDSLSATTGHGAANYDRVLAGRKAQRDGHTQRELDAIVNAFTEQLDARDRLIDRYREEHATDKAMIKELLSLCQQRKQTYDELSASLKAHVATCPLLRGVNVDE